MSEYRKKPLVIEAVRYLGGGNVENSDVPDWMFDAFRDGTLKATNGIDPLIVKTLSGPVTVAPGWWLCRGVAGELYPCEPDIFERTYEAPDQRPTPPLDDVREKVAEIRKLNESCEGSVGLRGRTVRICDELLAIVQPEASEDRRLAKRVAHQIGMVALIVARLDGEDYPAASATAESLMRNLKRLQRQVERGDVPEPTATICCAAVDFSGKGDMDYCGNALPCAAHPTDDIGEAE